MVGAFATDAPGRRPSPAPADQNRRRRGQQMSYDPMGDNEAEKRAIHDFFISVTLPILIEQDGQFGIAATGTLFKIAGRCLIVTAAHTYDAFHPDKWHYPSH